MTNRVIQGFRTMGSVMFLALLMGLATSAVAQPPNVLFYGNSFTLGFGSTRSVNAIFNDVAIAAGQTNPNARSAAASGQDLRWHVANNTSPIFTTIPLNQNWDFIVMQEHSTKLTRAYDGSPSFPASVAASQADAVALLNVAKSRSPNVVPVLFETWARAPGHTFYTGGTPLFSGPSEMQAEIRAGYGGLKSALDASSGNSLTRIAPVGDTWEAANYDRTHANDGWHAQNRGSLLAALTIYSTIYNDPTTSDIDLSGVLTSLNLTPQDGIELTRAVDAVVPEPGSLGGLLVGLVWLVHRKRRADEI